MERNLVSPSNREQLRTGSLLARQGWSEYDEAAEPTLQALGTCFATDQGQEVYCVNKGLHARRQQGHSRLGRLSGSEPLSFRRPSEAARTSRPACSGNRLDRLTLAAPLCTLPPPVEADDVVGCCQPERDSCPMLSCAMPRLPRGSLVCLPAGKPRLRSGSTQDPACQRGGLRGTQ